ncbi:hypothetical protein BD769DRAFT_1384265 [Suillus cothurnatus]|nr:hypothetical protein BD769DRAFT_1384265 [Suillus cothurnatus]
MGIWLESNQSIDWARNTGGKGGSHPSNILDNRYALGMINVDGDMPVILMNEGPDMGGKSETCCNILAGTVKDFGTDYYKSFFIDEILKEAAAMDYVGVTDVDSKHTADGLESAANTDSEQLKLLKKCKDREDKQYDFMVEKGRVPPQQYLCSHLAESIQTLPIAIVTTDKQVQHEAEVVALLDVDVALEADPDGDKWDDVDAEDSDDPLMSVNMLLRSSST